MMEAAFATSIGDATVVRRYAASRAEAASVFPPPLLFPSPFDIDRDDDAPLGRTAAGGGANASMARGEMDAVATAARRTMDFMVAIELKGRRLRRGWSVFGRVRDGTLIGIFGGW
jgi:hypothetical protein